MSEQTVYVFDTPEGIEYFRLCSLKARLHMEIVGMKGRGESAFSQLKRLYGFKGNKKKVFELAQAKVNELQGKG